MLGADQPGRASYSANASYLYNDGKSAEIRRRSIGRYEVRFGRVATGGANVQVSMYGADSGYCNVANWGNGTVNVQCYNNSGAPADRRFVVLALKASAADKDKLVYAWLNNPTTASYVASPGYAFAKDTVNVRRTGAGDYFVDFKKPFNGPQYVTLVSGYNTKAQCGAHKFSIGGTAVGCWQASNSSPVDARASVLELHRGIGRVSVATTINPAGKLSPSDWGASDGSAQSVNRMSVGRYRVAVGPEAGVGGHVQVRAIGETGSCWPEAWVNGAVFVRCARNGVAKDMAFTVVALAPSLNASDLIGIVDIGPVIGPAIGTIELPPGAGAAGAADDLAVADGPRRQEAEAYAPSRVGPQAIVSFKLAGKDEKTNFSYEAVDGLAVTQGDIILGNLEKWHETAAERRAAASTQKTVCNEDGVCFQTSSTPLIVIEGENYFWPGGVVPFEIDDRFTEAERQSIFDGMALITGVTNIILKPREGEDDYVRFNRVAEGCASHVGRQGGRQDVFVRAWGESWCPPGSIAHEIMHTIGVWHEQSREDRNGYIRIIEENIAEGRAANFEQHISDGVDIAEYDYDSIMHYHPNAFGKTGPDGRALPTIEVLQPGKTVGQREQLSTADISGVNDIYKHEDCYSFDPDQLSFRTNEEESIWSIVEAADGDESLVASVGETQADAEVALGVMDHYGFSSVCHVGDDDPSVTYFLIGEDTPSGPMDGERCAPLVVEDALVINDDGWKIVEGEGDSAVDIIAFPNSGEAYRNARHHAGPRLHPSM